MSACEVTFIPRFMLSMELAEEIQEWTVHEMAKKHNVPIRYVYKAMQTIPNEIETYVERNNGAWLMPAWLAHAIGTEAHYSFRTRKQRSGRCKRGE